MRTPRSPKRETSERDAMPHATPPRPRVRRASRGFDFTAAMTRLVADIADRLPNMRHVRVERIAMSFAQTRSASSYGMYASLTPLRFEGGGKTMRQRGGTWAMQKVRDSAGREMFYILTFYLPRFLDLSFDAKLTTVFHELYHISPRFDGDIRRFSGRCYAHTGSQKNFDAAMLRMARRWLALGPPRAVWEFLLCDFAALTEQYGAVHGNRVAAPKVYRVA